MLITEKGPLSNKHKVVCSSCYFTNFLPRVNINNYNVLIGGRNFYDQPINDQIRKYDELTKVTTGRGDNYTTGCLLDYQYFKDHYKLIAVHLSKLKELDADPRVIKQNRVLWNARY